MANETMLDAALSSAQTGFDLNTEMACYGLPYGGLGFTSHVLTYYSLACLWCGVSPYWPARKIKYGRVDIALSSTSLIVSSVMAISTLVKCRNTWQLLAIGVWKLSVSLTNGITSLNIAILVFRANNQGEKEKQEKELTEAHVRGNEAGVLRDSVKALHAKLVAKLRNTIFWVLLYIPGAIAGMAGLMSLASPYMHDSKVHILTIFFAVWVASVGMGFISSLAAIGIGGPLLIIILTVFGAGIMAFLLLAPFYGDWMLGFITGNLGGVPSKDNSAFYWTYFIAKRLVMFSS